MTQNRMRSLFVTAIIDFFKANGHRIAEHTYSRQPAPLAGRDDIKPFLPIIKGDSGQHLDILTLDPEKKLNFIAIHYD
ncbi:MAG: hypothetical protein ACFFCQ_07235, partial [Promethearchaeota archaeon]